MSPSMESEVPEENGVEIQLFSSVDTTDRKSTETKKYAPTTHSCQRVVPEYFLSRLIILVKDVTHGS